jgi:hypothetical protein
MRRSPYQVERWASRQQAKLLYANFGFRLAKIQHLKWYEVLSLLKKDYINIQEKPTAIENQCSLRLKTS